MSSTRKIEVFIAANFESRLEAGGLPSVGNEPAHHHYTRTATLIIGGKAFTEEEVRTMLEEMMATSNCMNGYRIKRDAVRSIAAKHGITP